MANSNQNTVRIRMYRQGLGDCFLLTFQKNGRDDFNMMIDCGLLQGTSNGTELMRKVAEDAEATLQVKKTVNGSEKKWLDVLVLTHEHVDHISGFSQAQDIFDRIHFGEVWAGWVDDPHHPNYKAVRERFHKQVTGLKAALSKMKSNIRQGLKENVASLLEDFFDENILGAAGSKTGRSPAWDYALGKSVNNPKFGVPGNLFSLPGVDGVRVYVLGPPEDYETFTQVDPPSDETYRDQKKGGKFALAESFFAAVAGENSLFDTELYQPFENHLRIDAEKEAPKDEFFKVHYGFAPNSESEWRRINEEWLMTAGSLALNLDTYTNNTCLALAVEFIESKKVLLFPGDAQFANWISWQRLKWEIVETNGEKRQVDVKDLLKRTVFYKVGHHGSHNATLKTHGLEMMTSPELAAMIPVDTAKAKSKTSKTNPNGWEMPEKNLFERLLDKTQGRLIVADENSDAGLKSRCQDGKFIETVRFDGASIRALKNSSREEPLYVELVIEG